MSRCPCNTECPSGCPCPYESDHCNSKVCNIKFSVIEYWIKTEYEKEIHLLLINPNGPTLHRNDSLPGPADECPDHNPNCRPGDYWTNDFYKLSLYNTLDDSARIEEYFQIQIPKIESFDRDDFIVDRNYMCSFTLHDNMYLIGGIGLHAGHSNKFRQFRILSEYHYNQAEINCI